MDTAEDLSPLEKIFQSCSSDDLRDSFRLYLELFHECIAQCPHNRDLIPLPVTRAGESPLHVSILLGKEDLALALLLMERENVVKEFGIESESIMNIFSAVYEKEGATIGPDLFSISSCFRPSMQQARNKKGETPLFLAAGNGNLDLFSRLVQLGCDPAAPSLLGATPLHYAAQEGRVEIVEVLLFHHKVYPCPTNRALSTPLHFACQDGHIDVVRLFLKKFSENCLFISVNLQNRGGYTPLDLAVEGKHSDVVTLLRSIGGKTSKEEESFDMEDCDKDRNLAYDNNLQKRKRWGDDAMEDLKKDCV